jgi:hypothetical protein
MEVHHHSHTPDSHRGRKKWTHYFWEFLMLFLAVFCGFLAENKREHMIEHQREKKFAKRLLLDLREDTAFCKKRIDQLETNTIAYKEFLEMMAGPETPSDSMVVRSFLDLTSRGYATELTSATYNQMKTSGSLRYVRNDELTTALQKYYEIQVPKNIRDPDDLIAFFADQISRYMIQHFRLQELNDLEDSTKHISHKIIERSSRSDQEMINLLGIYNAIAESIDRRYKETLRQAYGLIALIQKEYHLR